MTAADWKYLEDNFSLFKPINLLCDGDKVSLYKEADNKKDRLINVLFVNGQCRGVWANEKENHPQSKYLYRRKIICCMYSKEDLRKFEKRFGKDMAERLKPKPIITLTPFFPSFKAFKQHIIKTCKEIEIIRD